MINLGGYFLGGEYYNILYAHTCLRLKNVWTLWTLWTIDKCANVEYSLICNSVDFFLRLLHFFRISCILPFFYPNLSSNFAPQFKIISRSSHVHRVTIAHTYTSNRYEPCGRSSSAKEQPSLRRSSSLRRSKRFQDPLGPPYEGEDGCKNEK